VGIRQGLKHTAALVLTSCQRSSDTRRFSSARTFLLGNEFRKRKGGSQALHLPSLVCVIQGYCWCRCLCL